jgi:hypothetical protein
MRLTGFIMFIVFTANHSHAQAKRALLDVYKIDFGFYTKVTDTNTVSEVPMHVGILNALNASY